MQQYLLATGGFDLGLMMPMVLMVAIFYLLLIRPQRKRDKQAKEMRNSLEVGDEILTIGGILGRVVNIREDSLLIESGSANTKIRITKGAVQANITAQENAAERQKAAQQAANEEKQRKKGKGNDDTSALAAAEEKEKELEKKLDKE